MHNDTIRATIFICALFALFGCTASPVTFPLVDGDKVWPAPPADARIRFVTAFSRPEDLGIKESAWDRFVKFSVGSEDKSMVRPMAVAATPDGQVIYVADPDRRCIHRFDLTRRRYDCLGDSLISPVGLAMSAEGQLYVADSALDTVFVLEPSSDVLQALRLSPAPVQPTGLAAGPTGDLFVTCTGDHVIRRYDRTGEMVATYGGRGDSLGSLNYPTYLWLNHPRELLVTDTMNFRIQRFDIDDAVMGAFGEAGDGTGSLARPKGVAMDSHGHVYVIDGQHNALQIFDRDGQLLLALGERGIEAGQFWLPSGIFVTSENLILVADSYNRRVQIFRYIGDQP